MRDRCTHKESGEKSCRERDKGNVLKDKSEKKKKKQAAARNGSERGRRKGRGTKME